MTGGEFYGFDGLGLDGLDGLDGPEDLPEFGANGATPGDAADGSLVLDIGGGTYGLPAPHELDGTVGDAAVTLTDDRGMAVCTDTDGDGYVDRLSVVGFDGSWSSWRRTIDGRDTPGVPPSTPGSATDNWKICGWECVERGQWG